MPVEEYDHFIGYLEGQLERVTVKKSDVKEGEATARLGA